MNPLSCPQSQLGGAYHEIKGRRFKLVLSGKSSCGFCARMLEDQHEGKKLAAPSQKRKTGKLLGYQSNKSKASFLVIYRRPHLLCALFSLQHLHKLESQVKCPARALSGQYSAILHHSL